MTLFILLVSSDKLPFPLWEKSPLFSVEDDVLFFSSDDEDVAAAAAAAAISCEASAAKSPLLLLLLLHRVSTPGFRSSSNRRSPESLDGQN